jgi:hypothetical protein
VQFARGGTSHHALGNASRASIGFAMPGCNARATDGARTATPAPFAPTRRLLHAQRIGCRGAVGTTVIRAKVNVEGSSPFARQLTHRNHAVFFSTSAPTRTTVDGGHRRKTLVADDVLANDSGGE